MFEYHIFRVQWLYLALFGGIMFTAIVVLTYFDFWKPRKEDENGKTEHRYLKGWSSIPWSLKLTYIASIVYAFAYTIYRFIKEANG